MHKYLTRPDALLRIAKYAEATGPTVDAGEATYAATPSKQVVRNADGYAQAVKFIGDLEGDVVGNVTGNVEGDLEGNVTGNADTATLADDALTAKKVSALGLFISDVIDGTGAEQEIGHGLMADDGTTPIAPSFVFAGFCKVAAEGDVITQGTHTASVLKITAPLDTKFQVIAKR